MGELFHRLLNFEYISDAQKIALSFLFVMLMGAFLLCLPISNQSHTWLAFEDALFMATSATCVTGLGTITIQTSFTLFGKIVMLILIQVGGLGLMTLMAIFVSGMNKRLSLRETKLIKTMLNSNAQLDMRRFLKDIITYVAIIEGIGAILLMFVFVPDHGILEGIFHSIFISISAFCNAGFDALGSTSLSMYAHHYYVVGIVMLLVLIGGIGFAVWFDLRDGLKAYLKKEKSWKLFIHSLSLHTKIVLGFSLFLIVVPALIWLMIEWNNPSTIGSFSVVEKCFCALAEMVFLRTAGFTTFDYSGLSQSAALLMMALMFIGGSPGGTAGGIKTTTFFVIVLYVVSMLSGRSQTVFKNRSIPKGVLMSAMGVLFLNMVVLFSGIFLLTLVESFSLISLSFEAVSALATVGSTLGVTTSLGSIAKYIIIAMMYIGRIGITTMLLSMIRYDDQASANALAYPEADIVVG